MVLLNQRIYHIGSVHTVGTTINFKSTSTSMTVFQSKDHDHSNKDTTLQGSSSFANKSQPAEVHVDVAIDRESEV